MKALNAVGGRRRYRRVEPSAKSHWYEWIQVRWYQLLTQRSTR